MSIKLLISIFLLLFASTAYSQSETPADGQVRTTADGQREAWDARDKAWLTLDQFWESYADRRGGLTWGRRNDYPPYAEVRELDTMIIELDSGSCMMMFFHTRWRRANDVRRWDDAFNRFSACPYVFD